MPWRVKKGGGTCADDEWAVLKRTDGSTVGCHPSKSKALSHLAALNANVEERATLHQLATLVIEADRVRQKLRRSSAIERATTERVGNLFRRQGRYFTSALAQLRPAFRESARRIREAPTEAEWGHIWERASRQVRADFQDALDLAARLALTEGANALVGHLELDTSFDLSNPRAVRYLQQHGGHAVAGIDAESRAQVRTILGNAAESGWSYTRTADALIERFSSWAVGSPLRHIQSRAELIAVTETAQAYEAGNRLMADQIVEGLPPGMAMEKSWLTVGDSRVDPSQCQPNRDQGWIPVEAAHVSGVQAPPAHPGCRCTELYRTHRVVDRLAR